MNCRGENKFPLAPRSEPLGFKFIIAQGFSPGVFIGLLLIFTILFLPTTSHASRPPDISRKLFNHFDQNKDGVLSLSERGRLNTHLIFGWPLVTKKKQMAYDKNRNGVLEPAELRRYRADKKSGKIKIVYKDFKVGYKKFKKEQKLLKKMMR